MNTIQATSYATSRLELAPTTDRNLAIGYLRAFITVLVLAHHAVLAYHPYAPAPPTSLIAPPRMWMAFPVVDAHRWSPFSMFVGFNDIFFMSLMFFLSGVFVPASMQRKGVGKFLQDRFMRLGLPFLVAAGIIAPLAYYPTYLMTKAGGGIAGFWHEWLSLGVWPVGPAWFLWVLLAFDCIAAALFAALPNWTKTFENLIARSEQKPIALFAAIVTLSAAVYIPMELIFNGFYWSSFGPFFIQTSRLFHYLLYFLIGAVVGSVGLERGLLASTGNLTRRWYNWGSAALLIFVVAMVAIIAAIASTKRIFEVFGDIGFALSCAATSFAFLALFVRFAKHRTKLWDSLAANVYGMYLIHYAFVSWLQYALLPASMSGFTKGITVFAGTLLLSWATVATLRRLRFVARII